MSTAGYRNTIGISLHPFEHHLKSGKIEGYDETREKGCSREREWRRSQQVEERRSAVCCSCGSSTPISWERVSASTWCNATVRLLYLLEFLMQGDRTATHGSFIVLILLDLSVYLLLHNVVVLLCFIAFYIKMTLSWVGILDQGSSTRFSLGTIFFLSRWSRAEHNYK